MAENMMLKAIKTYISKIAKQPCLDSFGHQNISYLKSDFTKQLFEIILRITRKCSNNVVLRLPF